MRSFQTAVVLAVVLSNTACTELGYVPKKDYDAVQAKLTETENKLREADKQVADFQAHRYSIFHQGWRTWRLDSVTGDTCIQLTTEVDWKKADTQRQSCDCKDYLRDTPKAFSKENEAFRKLYCGV